MRIQISLKYTDLRMEEVEEKLTLLKHSEDALLYTLALLDFNNPETYSKRVGIARELEKFFERPKILSYVENILFSRPAPPKTDFDSGIRVAY